MTVPKYTKAEMTFKDKVVAHIRVPYEKAILRPVEGIDCVTVYFHGKALPQHIFNEDNFNDELPYFLHYVQHGSDLMVEAAVNCFGENWQRRIRCIIPNGTYDV